MKDTELRGIVLQSYYDNRRDSMFLPEIQDPSHRIIESDVVAISEQLAEHGLIQWASVKGLGGVPVTGMGKITASGIDVVEGAATPNIKIEFVQHKSVTISGSSNVIVGDHNHLAVTNHVMALSQAIDATEATTGEKDEAKGLLRKFAEHPLVVAIAGGAVTLLGG